MVKRISGILLSLSMILTIFMSVSFCCYAAGDTDISKNPHVLFLSSYSYEWESNPKQLQGVADTLNGYAKVDYVFMDTKRLNYDDVKDDIYKNIRSRESKRKYDYVLAADDAALVFVKEYRKELFDGVPVVFEGINNVDTAEEAAKDPLMTGIVEAFPLHETIALADKLNPAATKVVGISDSTISGIGSTKQFMDCKDSFPNLAFSTIDCSSMTCDEIGKKVAGYGNDTILVFLMMTTDKDGINYSLTEAVEYVVANAKVPVCKADELGIGSGILGGVVVSYYDMAADAAKIILSVEKGAKISDFPLQTAKCRCEFDKKIMDRFKISKANISKAYDGEVDYINDVPSYFQKHKTVLVPAGIIIMLLICFSVFIIYQQKKAQIAEREAMEERAKNTAKSEFLARMSHDIRTPLNAVLGFASLACDETGVSDKVRDYLYKIETSGKYLLGLINDVLDMSKIESGKVELHEESVDSLRFLNGIAEVFGAQAQEKGIRLITDFSKATPSWVMMDGLRSRQIYANILSNAIKYSQSGTEIRWTVIDAPTGNDTFHMVSMIRDQGYGMSEEFLTKLFQPFEQADPLNAKSGTGLGMPIVKNLVDLMGGSIHVESAVGKGSTFVVELDRKIGTPQEEKKVSNVGSCDTLKGSSILICEDNHINIMVATGVLENAGCDVHVAENGQIGVDMFRDSGPGQYDAILMDIRMPVMDGLEAAREIRALDRDDAKTIPIIAMSANAFDEDIRKSLDAGMNAHLAKPIEPEILYSELKKYIHR